MGIRNAESEASRAWTDERDTALSPNNAGGQTGARRSSAGNGDFSSRTAGTFGERSDSNDTTSGGILDQLIEQAESQLVKAEEGIAWHQSKKEQALAQIEELRQLKELKQQTLETDDRGE